MNSKSPATPIILGSNIPSLALLRDPLVREVSRDPLDPKDSRDFQDPKVLLVRLASPESRCKIN